MKILLIIPPRSYNAHLGFSKFPDEIFTIAAVLEKSGNEVQIYDNNVNNYVDLHQPKGFISFNPDVIGFSVATSYQITSAIAQSIEFKRIMPGVKVVWGGMHPSVLPEQTLAESYIDYVVIGAGEYTLLELIQYLENDGTKLEEIKGLAYKKNGKICINEPRPFIKNLEELPDPAWHLVDVKRYREVTLCTGRGCPNDCAFCTNQTFHKGYVSDLSAERIVSQMEQLQERFGVRFLYFAGENFAFNYKRLKEFCNLVIRKKLKVKWSCEVSTIPREEDIILMANSGCVSVYFSVESGSQRMLNFLQKYITVEDVERAFWLFVKHKIMPVIFIMCGLPTETIEDFKMNQELLERLDKPPYLYSRFVLYPGTTLFDYCVANGSISPPQKLADWPNFAEQYASKVSLSDVPQGMISEATTGFFRIFAARRMRFTMKHNPSYFWKIILNPLEFFQAVKALIKCSGILERRIFPFSPPMPAEGKNLK